MFSSAAALGLARRKRIPQPHSNLAQPVVPVQFQPRTEVTFTLRGEDANVANAATCVFVIERCAAEPCEMPRADLIGGGDEGTIKVVGLRLRSGYFYFQKRFGELVEHGRRKQLSTPTAPERPEG